MADSTKASRTKPSRRAALLLAAVFSAAAADTAEQLYQTGLKHIEQGKHEAAVVSLEESIRMRASHAPAWKALGVAHAAMGDHPLAEPAFRKACELAPSLEDACFYHGRILYLLNRFDEAVSVLRKTARGDPRAHRVTALSLDGLGRWGEAEGEFRTAIRVYRRKGEDPRVDYGVSLLRQGRPEEALPHLQAAVADAPGSARAHLEAGRALVLLDRRESAVTHLERAVALDSTTASAHLLLGRIYTRLGRSAEAARHLRQGSASAR
ncbi:MAG: tetratricopeptide repeat protein [Bryobacteraceae bacterium]